MFRFYEGDEVIWRVRTDGEHHSRFFGEVEEHVGFRLLRVEPDELAYFERRNLAVNPHGRRT